jgi:cytosine/adenosine deaminase-related metal-dependent hydrolase
MILHDVSIYGSEGDRHIHIAQGKIKSISADRKMFDALVDEQRFELDGAIVLPGLINAHDHLDFNLFPALGNRIYNNYTEWGNNIHTENAGIINNVLKIPLHLRVRWGLYKNLLNGFTTVMNHGDHLEINDELVDVFQDSYSLHSPAFEKNWILKLNSFIRRKKPFVMHIGEGTDTISVSEIDSVKRFNFFKRTIIAVHGVAMNKGQASAFAGVVWCPASNFFLLGKTAAIDKLSGATTIVFGTDSTLTADWNAWQHFRQAMKTNMVNEEELVKMLTVNPATLLKLDDRGVIGENKRADILVMKKADGLFDRNPEDILMVIQGGKLKLLDESLENQWRVSAENTFTKIKVNGASKLIVGDINGLMNEIRQYYNEVDFPVVSGEW